MKLSEMTRDERSLLLYFETCAVDHGGLVEGIRMNADDFSIAKEWDKSGFVSFSRLTFASIESLMKQGRNHRVFLSEEAWKLAHEERRERSNRMNAKPPYCDLITTKTKNAKIVAAEETK